MYIIHICARIEVAKFFFGKTHFGKILIMATPPHTNNLYNNCIFYLKKLTVLNVTGPTEITIVAHFWV